jgi:hypothetical protein
VALLALQYSTLNHCATRGATMLQFLLILRQLSNYFNIHYRRKLLYNIMAMLFASPITVDFHIFLTLLFTQERYGTIVDPLGSLNNLMMLTR